MALFNKDAPKTIAKAVEVAKGLSSVISKPTPFADGGSSWKAGPTYIPPGDPEREKNFQRWFSGSAVTNPDGTPKVVYHNTPTEFDAFDTRRSEMGSHFGTPEQANSFMVPYPKTGNTAMARQNIDMQNRGKRTVPVHLSIKNPYRLIDKGSFYPGDVARQLHESGIIDDKTLGRMQVYDGTDDDKKKFKELQELLKSHGHDGIVYLNRAEGNIPDTALTHATRNNMTDEEFKKFAPGAEDSYIAFHPGQIKSAIGNNGNYSTNPDFTKAGGGEVRKHRDTGGGVTKDNDYDTAQDGPFYRVARSYAGPTPGLAGGIRPEEWPSAPPNAGADGPSGDGASAPSPLQTHVDRALKDPTQNGVKLVADDYVRRMGGSGVEEKKMPPSSLAKQSAIAKAYEMAAEGSPAYKQAIFAAYQHHMPDVVKSSGAENYDQLLKASYAQMAKETSDQFDHLPLKYSFYKNGEGAYSNSKSMLQDLHGNGHLFVYQGGDRHEFLHNVDPRTGLNENEKFRAVHDAFGHGILGNTFGPQGEERAWGMHSQMYSPLARLAMSSETRGQNSYVNYSPINADLKGHVAEIERRIADAWRRDKTDDMARLQEAKKEAMNGWQYAPQKAVLLPPEFLSHDYAGGMPEYVRKLAKPAPGTSFSSPLTHYSTQKDLTELDPTKYGTGLRGDERSRVGGRGAVKDRVYAYLGEPGKVTPEPGIGPNQYAAHGEDLYDMTKDPAKLGKLARESNRHSWMGNFNPGVVESGSYMNDFERLAKEYGYRGIANPNHQHPMAVMFDKVPVRKGRAPGGRADNPFGDDFDDMGHDEPPEAAAKQPEPLDPAKLSVISKYVDNPQNTRWSELYGNPKEIAAKASEKVAPENLNMKKLFGVDREELYQMGKGRKGNMEPNVPGFKDNASGSRNAKAVMNPSNAKRIQDILYEAGQHRGLQRGMDAWYTMDPAYHRLSALVGPEEAARRYSRLNNIVGMMSPATPVHQELNRGLAAYYLDNQGRIDDFIKHGGTKVENRRRDFPADMKSIIPHPYHSTAHSGPLKKYIDSGELQMKSAKVPLYIQASGVPETGFQTSLPVPDAHFTRAVGMGNVRSGASPGVSMKAPEAQTFGPWFRDKVAAPLGLESVPAQARLWGAASHITGVDTDIGSPKLELLTNHIMQVAHKKGVSPETARDMVLMGKAYADGGNVRPRLQPDENNFYSQGAVAAASLPQAKGTSQQMIAMLNGKVKPEEIKWSGVKQRFAEQPTVTREELAQHFQNNAPKLKVHKLEEPFPWTTPEENEGDIGKTKTKYGEYVLPGGENYQEHLLTMPRGEKPYRSSHWDQPNVAVHVRMNDRNDDEGNSLLHLEELQSDWGQAARKGKAVAEAPYIGNTSQWTDLALKHALTEAAKGKYDKLSWTPGEDQAARYDLTKKIGKINYHPENKELAAYGPTGHAVLYKGHVEPSDLSEHIGKELSSRLLEAPRDEFGRHSLVGNDMKVGGEGMKGYYDKIVPSRLMELAKKLDPEAKIGTSLVPSGPHKSASIGYNKWGVYKGDYPASNNIISTHPNSLEAARAAEDLNMRPVPSMEITPKMRENILKGFPAYARGGAVAKALELTKRKPRWYGGQTYDFTPPIIQTAQGSVDGSAYTVPTYPVGPAAPFNVAAYMAANNPTPTPSVSSTPASAASSSSSASILPANGNHGGYNPNTFMPPSGNGGGYTGMPTPDQTAISATSAAPTSSIQGPPQADPAWQAGDTSTSGYNPKPAPVTSTPLAFAGDPVAEAASARPSGGSQAAAARVTDSDPSVAAALAPTPSLSSPNFAEQYGNLPQGSGNFPAPSNPNFPEQYGNFPQGSGNFPLSASVPGMLSPQPLATNSFYGDSAAPTTPIPASDYSATPSASYIAPQSIDGVSFGGNGYVDPRVVDSTSMNIDGVQVGSGPLSYSSADPPAAPSAPSAPVAPTAPKAPAMMLDADPGSLDDAAAAPSAPAIPTAVAAEAAQSSSADSTPAKFTQSVLGTAPTESGAPNAPAEPMVAAVSAPPTGGGSSGSKDAINAISAGIVQSNALMDQIASQGFEGETSSTGSSGDGSGGDGGGGGGDAAKGGFIHKKRNPVVDKALSIASSKRKKVAFSGNSSKDESSKGRSFGGSTLVNKALLLARKSKRA